MSNRLAELEQYLLSRTANRRVPTKQRKQRSALNRMRQSGGAIAIPSVPASPAAAGLSAKVSRWPSRRHAISMAAQRARAYNAISYDVPGVFNVIAQPSSMACWATVFTMLKSWRSQQSMSIEEALRTVGQRWVDIYRSNSGLSGDDKVVFLSIAGLAAEPPQSFTVEGWEQLLRNYGPIWVTTDEAPGKTWAIHARIITGIQGDGTLENTRFKIVDPAGGRRYEESIATFLPKYEEEVIRTGYMRIQVVHWQTDARSEQQAITFGRNIGSRSRPMNISAALTAQRQARAMGAIDVRYNVQLVRQQTDMSCWAAGFAMIVGWRDQISIDPAEIARPTGYWEDYREALNACGVNHGLPPNDREVMNLWGFVPEPPQTYTVDAFADLLRNYGPLWVASAEPGPHIRVVTGIQGDGTPDGTLLYINDPWEQGMTIFRPNNRGSQYTETYRQFVEKQSTLGGQEINLNAPIYVAHLPELPSWMNSSTAQNFSYFMGRPVAMESPSNPDNYRLLTSGTWNSNTRLTVQGGQGVWFKIKNVNVLGTTISIADQAGQNKQSIILPQTTVEFVFTTFGTEPMGWCFDIRTDSDAFMVTWELWSTWVPGMQSYQERRTEDALRPAVVGQIR